MMNALLSQTNILENQFWCNNHKPLTDTFTVANTAPQQIAYFWDIVPGAITSTSAANITANLLHYNGSSMSVTWLKR